jgi:transcriptional regulator with XRE-family HTH domain
MGTADIYPLIGDAIKHRRKLLSLTQDKLASALHISRASLANIEAGRQKILIHHLYAFADALQLDVKDLLVDMPSAALNEEEQLPLPTGLNELQRLQVMKVFAAPTNEAKVPVEIDETR